MENVDNIQLRNSDIGIPFKSSSFHRKTEGFLEGVSNVSIFPSTKQITIKKNNKVYKSFSFNPFMKREMKLFLNTLLVLSLFLSLGIASAATTANMTATNVSYCVREKLCDNILSKSVVINVSYDNAYQDQNWSSANLYIIGKGKTANTTLVLVNGSATPGATQYKLNRSNNMSITINSSAFEDGVDYNITISLFNGSNYLNISFSPSWIDNTIPQAPTLVLADKTAITSTTTQNFSSTVIDRNTTECTYTLYRDGSASDTKSKSGSASYYGTSCSFTNLFSDSSDNGRYIYAITASDGTNTTSSSSDTFNVNLPGSTGGLPAGQYQTKEGKTFTVAETGEVKEGVGLSTGLIVGGIAAVVLIIVVVFIVRKK